MTPQLARRYLLWMMLPLLVTALGISLWLVRLQRTNSLGPVPFTGNSAFDEKMELLRRRAGQPLDVLAVGSSMTFNNLHTDELLKVLPPGTRYFNASAWGLKIGRTRELAEFLVPRYQPKAVVIVTGFMDFHPAPESLKPFEQGELGDFLFGGNYALQVLSHFDARYYWKQSANIHHRRTSRGISDSLQFDTGGGVPLDVHYPNVEPSAWSMQLRLTTPPSQYEQLDELLAFLKSRQVKLFVAQSPIRRVCITPEGLERMQEFWNRLDQSLRPPAGYFVNLHSELELDDSCYSDHAHLNAKGSAIFTQALMRHIGQPLRAALQSPSTQESAGK